MGRLSRYRAYFILDWLGHRRLRNRRWPSRTNQAIPQEIGLMSENKKLRYVVIGVIFLSLILLKALLTKDWVMFVASILGLFIFIKLTARLGDIPGLYRLAMWVQVANFGLGIFYHLLPSMQVPMAFVWFIWMIVFPLRWIYKIQKSLPLVER